MDGCGSDDGRSRRIDDEPALSSHDHIVLHYAVKGLKLKQEQGLLTEEEANELERMKWFRKPKLQRFIGKIEK